MKKFEGTIVETLIKKIIVEAESREEAKDIINKQYSEEKIVLDSADFDEMSLNIKEVFDDKEDEPLKSGIYEVLGNTVEYIEGEAEGYNVDLNEYVPIETIRDCGEFIDFL